MMKFVHGSRGCLRCGCVVISTYGKSSTNILAVRLRIPHLSIGLRDGWEGCESMMRKKERKGTRTHCSWPNPPTLRSPSQIVRLGLVYASICLSMYSAVGKSGAAWFGKNCKLSHLFTHDRTQHSLRLPAAKCERSPQSILQGNEVRRS